MNISDGIVPTSGDSDVFGVTYIPLPTQLGSSPIDPDPNRETPEEQAKRLFDWHDENQSANELQTLSHSFISDPFIDQKGNKRLRITCTNSGCKKTSVPPFVKLLSKQCRGQGAMKAHV